MFANLLHQSVTVWHPGSKVARSGETVESWDTPTLAATCEGWLQPRQSSEDTDHRSQESTLGVLFVPVGTQIEADDRVGIDAGEPVWVVAGPPLESPRWRAPLERACEAGGRMSGSVTWEPLRGPWLNEVLVAGGTEQAVMSVAADIAARAASTAPVDTGKLRASFRTTSRVEGDRVIGYAYTDDEIAPYVEFGDTAARGFFRRAAGR